MGPFTTIAVGAWKGAGTVIGGLWAFRLTVPALILAVIVGAAAWFAWDAHRQEAKRIEAEAKLVDAADANDASIKAIERLQQLLVDAIGKHRAVEEANGLVTAERDRLQRRMAAARAEAQRERTEVYANDMSCSVLRTVPVCSAILDRLRPRAD